MHNTEQDIFIHFMNNVFRTPKAEQQFVQYHVAIPALPHSRM